MALQQVGRQGYVKMIGDDIALAELLYQKASDHPELEAVSQNLSITTLRYVPVNGVTEQTMDPVLLNKINETLLNQLQKEGQVFLSNAVIDGKYCLRACIVNFRTSEKDIEEVIDIIVAKGRKVCKELSNAIGQ